MHAHDGASARITAYTHNSGDYTLRRTGSSRADGEGIPLLRWSRRRTQVIVAVEGGFYDFRFRTPGSRVEAGRQTQSVVVLGEGEGLGPVGGDDGVGADIEFFGFGFQVGFGDGGFVFLFLERAAHGWVFL